MGYFTGNENIPFKVYFRVSFLWTKTVAIKELLHLVSERLWVRVPSELRLCSSVVER